MTLKLCQLIEYLKKNILWKNHPESMLQNLVPDPFLILVNHPKQPLYARNYFLKSRSSNYKLGSEKSLY